MVNLTFQACLTSQTRHVRVIMQKKRVWLTWQDYVRGFTQQTTSQPFLFKPQGAWREPDQSTVEGVESQIKLVGTKTVFGYLCGCKNTLFTWLV